VRVLGRASEGERAIAIIQTLALEEKYQGNRGYALRATYVQGTLNRITNG